jgi:hypothetical protein
MKSKIKCKICKRIVVRKSTNQLMCASCRPKQIRKRMKRYLKKYLYNRYHSDSKYRLKLLKAIRKYSKTKKGRKACKKALAKWRSEFKNRVKAAKWIKRRKKEALMNSYCTICFKNPHSQGFKTCDKCRIKARNQARRLKSVKKINWRKA